MFAHSQAGHGFKGETAVFLRFSRFQPQRSLDCLNHRLAACMATGQIFTHANDVAGGRFVVKHGVKLNDAMHIGQGNAQRLANGFLYLWRQPTINVLGFMEQREERFAGTAVISF